MRDHQIKCRIKGSKSQNDIQRTINEYAALHIFGALQHSDLSRESQIELLSRLIEELKK